MLHHDSADTDEPDAAPWPILPRGYSFTGASDLMVMTPDGEWHFGAEAEELMRGAGADEVHEPGPA